MPGAAGSRTTSSARCGGPWPAGAAACRKVRIDPSVLADPEMAEDLVAAAFNDAVNRINAESQAKMSAATAGMSLPPGMKLPF